MGYTDIDRLAITRKDAFALERLHDATRKRSPRRRNRFIDSDIRAAFLVVGAFVGWVLAFCIAVVVVIILAVR